MENTYAKMVFGDHYGKHINEVPIDYLVWLFPKLQDIEHYRRIYREILKYLLTLEIEVEFVDNEYRFITKEYEVIDPDEHRVPFLKTNWRGEDTNGNFVYEIGTKKYPLFLKESNGKFEITNNYVSYIYKYGGQTMIYEKNTEYYILDNEGKPLVGAYLLRKPFIPKEIENKDFLNFKI